MRAGIYFLRNGLFQEKFTVSNRRHAVNSHGGVNVSGNVEGRGGLKQS